MRIAFITDLHLDYDFLKTRSLNNFERFESVLADALTFSPDMIVLGGDLCNVQGQMEIYAYVKEKLDKVSLPYHVIPGNHDDATMINRVFYDENRDEAYRHQNTPDDIDMFFLDSSKGQMSEAQWEWFQTKLSDSFRPIIFMHHPPLLCGSAHMEPKYAFIEMQRFDQCLVAADRYINVIAGHYHMERSIVHAYCSVFVTPSTYLQIDPRYKELVLDSSYSGYRQIEITEIDFRTNIKNIYWKLE